MTNAHTDPRSDKMKREMATHFQEMEADYRDADWGHIVYEDDQVVVVSDHKGHEFDEWQSEFPDEDFSAMMHDLAAQVTDHDWGSSYPVVFDKVEADQ